MEKNRIVISIKDNVIWTQIFNTFGQIESSYISDTQIEALQKAQDFLGQRGDLLEQLKDKLSRRNMQIKGLQKKLKTKEQEVLDLCDRLNKGELPKGFQY